MDPPLLTDPVGRLLELADRPEVRTLVALGGLPGSGKTALAQRLGHEANARAGQRRVIALGMDGFHLTRDALGRMPDPGAALRRRGAPWTFDVDGLLWALRQVASAFGLRAVPWPEFDHEAGDPIQAGLEVPPDVPVVLVEGLYLLGGRHASAEGIEVRATTADENAWEEVGRCFDERWYLDTPPAVARRRLARRHMEAWRMTPAEADARIEANDRLNAMIVAETRRFADFLIAS